MIESLQGVPRFMYNLLRDGFCEKDGTGGEGIQLAEERETMVPANKTRQFVLRPLKEAREHIRRTKRQNFEVPNIIEEQDDNVVPFSGRRRRPPR
jgi:hypothetical protein